MPRFTQNTNQDLCHNGIQNSNLSVQITAIPTRMVEGKRRVSHFAIARLFDCNPALLCGALDEFRDQDGQADSVVVCDGMIRYIDDRAFSAAVRAYGWHDVPVLLALVWQVLAALDHASVEVAA
jgi:hypothetical protein